MLALAAIAILFAVVVAASAVYELARALWSDSPFDSYGEHDEVVK